MKTTARDGRAMGSPLRLTLPGSRQDETDAGWQIVAGVFRRAERDLTRFDASSALSRVNLSVGTTVHVPRRLGRALALAWRAFRITGGRFDPRIIGALEAAGERAGVALPRSPAVLSAGDRWIWGDPRRGRVRLMAPVDLGGIGKGLALRWAATALRRAGHGDFLIQAGGDIVVRGAGPGARPWIVGLENPLDGERPLALLQLRDAALATSSIAIRHWFGADGTLRHHLIDPATGAPASPIWQSVTVLASDPVWAEVASKAGFLAGSRIIPELRARPAWWVSSEGALHASPAGAAQVHESAPFLLAAGARRPAPRWYAQTSQSRRAP